MFLSTTAVALVCLGLFDAGLFAAQVANQSIVLAIDPAAPAQFNSAYMVVYFVGGSLGTAFGAAAAGWFGWPITSASAAAAIALAAVITALPREWKTLVDNWVRFLDPRHNRASGLVIEVQRSAVFPRGPMMWADVAGSGLQPELCGQQIDSLVVVLWT